ncbi:hypothetical protein [Nocardioides houyundeii]|uniref:hypothetical protein n=1 Tax=Nocardioides houyundeii TaxID=2045452 RepID=UPI001315AC0C|nr:hypothetical protein [Nocardioides houyundeii]
MDKGAALVAASSSKWEDRAVAAEALGSMDDVEADAALGALLNDEDLGVIERAAACLLGLPTTRALELFTGAYAVVDDQRGDAMNDQLRVAVVRNPKLRPALLELANGGEAGARAVLAWLG